MKTGIIKDKRYMEHNMGDFHPESPQRLEAIYRMIEKDISFPLIEIEPREASEEEIEYIHTPDYFKMVKATSGKPREMLDPDTSTCSRSFDVALLAAGGLLNAADHIMQGKIQNGFAFIRPPGHHAEASRAMGFCLFNNIAVAAEYLKRKYNQKRILIFDWDLHHGNGTQHSFYDRKDVLYVSTHQYPHYPGTGRWDEIGTGKGEGFTVNVPLSAGKTNEDYLYLLDKVIAPVIKGYKPEFILISAGFDIYYGDPLGGMRITAQGFGAMAARLLELASIFSGNKILFALEGGYNLEGLQEGCREVLTQLAGKGEKPDIKASPSQDLISEIAPVFEIHKEYWEL